MSSRTYPPDKITTDPRWDEVFSFLTTDDLQPSTDQQLDQLKWSYVSLVSEVIHAPLTNIVKAVNACPTKSKFKAYIKKNHQHWIAMNENAQHVEHVLGRPNLTCPQMVAIHEQFLTKM